MLRGLGNTFGWFGSRRRSKKRLEAIVKRAKAVEQWYAPTPWWEHPMWGDTFKDKSGARRKT